MTETSDKTINSMDFCSAFDKAWVKSPKFIGAIIESCLTRAAVRKSIILPPPGVVDEIISSTKAKRVKLLKNYILRDSRNSTDEAIREQDKIFTFRQDKPYFYAVEIKRKKIYLNGVGIKAVATAADGKTTLYEATGALEPMMESTTGATGGAKRKLLL